MATVIFHEALFTQFPVVDDQSAFPAIYANGQDRGPFTSAYRLYAGSAYGLGASAFDDQLDAMIHKEQNVIRRDVSGLIDYSVRYTDGFIETYTPIAGGPPSGSFPEPDGGTILGSGLATDGNGHLTGGTANALDALGMTMWNFSIDAKRLFDAFVSPNHADEEAIFAEILAGNDTLYIGQEQAGAISGLDGNDTVHGSLESDVILGGTGADKLFGRGGADDLSGEADNDGLNGAADADALKGGNGEDKLNGGAGKDTLNGGTGADKFIYNAKTEGGDKIVGFDATDVFQFEGSKFSLGTYAGTLKAANYRSVASGHAASDANDYFIYDKKLDQLWFDDDGKGAHKAVMIADLTNDFNLTASDILIV